MKNLFILSMFVLASLSIDAQGSLLDGKNNSVFFPDKPTVTKNVTVQSSNAYIAPVPVIAPIVYETQNTINCINCGDAGRIQIKPIQLDNSTNTVHFYEYNYNNREYNLKSITTTNNSPFDRLVPVIIGN